MGLFNKKKVAEEEYYDCLGLRLNTKYVVQLERFKSIYKALKTNEKVYTKSEIVKMNEAINKSNDGILEAIDFWDVFVWINIKEDIKFVSLISTIYVTDINLEGVEKHNIVYDGMYNVTEENLKKAFEYVQDLGFIFGSNIGSILETKIYKNVVNHIQKEYNVLLDKHFNYVQCYTTVMEKIEKEEYVSFINCNSKDK